MMAAPPDSSVEVDPLALLRDPPGPPRWHLRVSGIESGPVTWEVLRQLARDGTLKPTDHVRRTDEERWVPAAETRFPEPDSQAVRPCDPRVRLASRFAAGFAAAPASPPRATLEASFTDAPAAPTTPTATALSATRRPATPPPGSALLALALSLAGLVAFALPLGLLAIYLGGPSVAAAARGRGRRLHLAVAVAAVAVGMADAGFSLWVLGGRLSDLGGRAVALRR